MTCRGVWEFPLTITTNRENITQVVLNKGGKEKFGEVTLTKTPFEITVAWDEEKREIPGIRGGDMYDV